MGRWIIYPESRFVTEEELRRKFFDAVANGEIDEDETDYTLDSICKLLENTGKVTFAYRDEEPEDRHWWYEDED